MKMNFRWYGKEDKISLEQIRQIPGVTGIVSAIYDVPVGEIWPLERIINLKKEIEEHNLSLNVIESVPVPEDIKMGLDTRDKYIENYRETLKNIAKAGIEVVVYNFMPVFDWTRSQLDYELEDGSKALIYKEEDVQKMDPLKGDMQLPGWDTSYEQDELNSLMKQYQQISKNDLWNNLEYFLKQIIPVAEKNDIKMAIHPDDPPWSIFGLPRIITDKESLEKCINLVDSPSNGLALCSGSLGVKSDNNIPQLVRYFGQKGKIHFGHVRNIKNTGEFSFQEAAHKSDAGSLDIFEIMKAYYDIGFEGPIRPDHGRMIWGEEGKPGYGLYDRALGATYLNGIWETLVRVD